MSPPFPVSREVSVRVAADYACFSRPEMKVERVSYPCITPSAARGVLEAICWEPEFRWIVTSIGILKPIEFQAITRNEVQKKIPTNSVAGWMRDPSSFKPFYANARGREEGENATQRSTLALKDVAYNITGRVVFDSPTPREDESPEKYAAMFERRVARGQCYHRPYLGLREFAASFGPMDSNEPLQPIDMEMGRMLYDIIYAPRGSRRRNEPVFFQAKAAGGLVDTDPERVLEDPALRERVLTC